MKKTILILLTVSYTIASSIIIDLKKPIPPTLKKEIMQYWSFRIQKRFNKTYPFELPYLRYLHSLQWYIKYFQNTRTLKKVTIKKILMQSPEVYIVLLEIINEDEKTKHYIKDKWVRINKRWYHKFNDNPWPF